MLFSPNFAVTLYLPPFIGVKVASKVSSLMATTSPVQSELGVVPLASTERSSDLRGTSDLIRKENGSLIFTVG